MSPSFMKSYTKQVMRAIPARLWVRALPYTSLFLAMVMG